MGQKSIEELAKMLRENAAVRDEFRNDPEAVIARLGVSLSEAARKSLRSVDWKKMNDDELIARTAAGHDWRQWHGATKK